MPQMSTRDGSVCTGMERIEDHVERALRLINDGVDALAARLGIGARHLSRLLQTHVGVSPVQVAKSTRIQCAKRLLDETNLSLATIVMCTGFGSVRRFNGVFAELYKQPPTGIRRSPPAAR
jgi:AraC family transcriptional regulator of adaptative response/methylated-DNA-[protein]-cysteine methyltransferase